VFFKETRLKKLGTKSELQMNK